MASLDDPLSPIGAHKRGNRNKNKDKGNKFTIDAKDEAFKAAFKHRLHLFEFHDLPWIPVGVRHFAQEYLAALWRIDFKLRIAGAGAPLADAVIPLLCTAVAHADAVVPVLPSALSHADKKTKKKDKGKNIEEEEGEEETSSRRPLIIDLCAGAGGPSVAVASSLYANSKEKKRGGEERSQEQLPPLICLTDMFPHVAAWEAACKRDRAQTTKTTNKPAMLTYEPTSVDATDVPPHLDGVRVVWTAFHHFPPALAAKILADAVASDNPILIYEPTRRNILQILFIAVFTFVFSFIMPLIAMRLPLERFIFTYLLPVYPLTNTFDGVVSCLRTYTNDEMRVLIRAADPYGNFVWTIGSTTPYWFIPFFQMPYVLGVPKQKKQ